MKRLILSVTLVFVFTLLAGNSLAFSQATFKIPFKFYIEGKSYPPGDYWIAQQVEGKITLRKQPDREDILIPVIKKLEQPEPPMEGPELVFDMVGNFAPSYTEYITDYLLAEVWLPGKDGFLVLSKERAEDRTNIKGTPEKK